MIKLTDEMFERGIVSEGTAERLAAFRKKLAVGQKIVYGAIGGSITAGALAGCRQKTYVARIGAGLRAKVVNAGIGATNSMFGCFRADQKLLSAKPDLITIEFAVNDTNNPELAPSLEGLVRKCLSAPGKPLVLMIFTMNRKGLNHQEEHVKIGEHYGLPMYSYRDALYPEITAGRLAWREISPDTVHPNAIGHDLLARAVLRFLKEMRPSASEAGTLPPPLDPKAARYEKGVLLDAKKLKVLANHGWKTGPHADIHHYTGFQSDTPGSELVLEFEGTQAVAGFKCFSGAFGKVSIQADGRPSAVLDGFYERPPFQEWAGGHSVLAFATGELSPGKHRLRISLLEEKNPASTGHFFDLGYLLILP